MDSDCVLSAELDGCYYVTPAYNRTTTCHSQTNASCSSSVSSSCGAGDRSRLAALINEFNSNNHGLIMTMVITLTSSQCDCNISHASNCFLLQGVCSSWKYWKSPEI